MNPIVVVIRLEKLGMKSLWSKHGFLDYHHNW